VWARKKNSIDLGPIKLKFYRIMFLTCHVYIIYMILNLNIGRIYFEMCTYVRMVGED
jgi:hypothetical protein